MRHSATRALLERNDVIIVASVSCIYGIGAVETYAQMVLSVDAGAADRAQGAAAAAGRAAVQAQRPGLRPRLLPRAGRRRRDLPVAPGGPGLEAVAVRRRDRGDLGGRSADRREDGDARRHHHLPEQPLRDAAADAAAGDPAHQAGAEGARRRVRRATASCWRRSGCRSAPPTTWRCWRRSASATASRTTPAISPAAIPASRRRRCSSTSPRTRC